MTLLQDLRFALRTMLKSPGLALAGMVALALGIGANTAVFSMADAMLFKPLNLPDARGVVVAFETPPGRPGAPYGVSTANYLDWKAQSHSFEQMAAYQFWDMNLTSGGFPEAVQAIRVSSEFFPLLRARPALGRTFAAGEDQPGQERVVVLSHGLWERRFGADRGIVGRTIRLDLKNYTVLGVMPEGFEFPMAAELWCPLPLDARQKTSREGHWLLALGRLRPGVTKQQGEAELRTIAKRLEAAYPDTNHGWGAMLRTVREFVSGYEIQQGTILLQVSVGFVLLIACANVANVLLARSIARQKEIALRTALGASRWRIVRQLLTESVLLSGAGALLGILLAEWELDLMVSSMPANILKYVPYWHNIALDWRALLFTTVAAIFASAVSGLLPAIQCSRPDLNRMLKEGSRESATRRQHRLRGALLIGEIALSLVLLIGAGLMVRGLRTLRTAPGDHQPESMLTLRINLPDSRYPEPAKVAQFQSGLLSSLAKIPGVRHVAVTSMLPYAPSNGPQAFTVEGQVRERGATPNALMASVSPAFLALMRVPLRAGRFLTEADNQNGPKAVVISESVARRYWPGQNPIGRHVKLGRPDSKEPWMSVVGVAGDIRWNWFNPEGELSMYVPYAQNPQGYTFVAMRTSDPNKLISTVRATIAGLDPELPVGAASLAKIIDDSLIQLSYLAGMMAVLGVMALVLACVGVYGMMAYSVTEQTREIGIRMALGAETHHVLGMVMRRSAAITITGLLIGLVCSAGLARLLAGLIWGISALDLTTFAGVSGMLVAVALLASYIPARRASRVDPLISLRCE
jgi:putative ABC transport system permease protein